MNQPRFTSLTAIALLLVTTQTISDDSDVELAATVNGTPITIVERQVQAKQFQARGQAIDDTAVTEELISLEVMRQEAVKLGLDKSPEMAAEMKTMQSRVLANALLTSFTDNLNLTDEDLRAEYEKQVAMADAKEFKASHILVDDEAQAKEIIEELNGGADFAEAAKKYSTGPSGPGGGDLGWFDSGAMVPEFSQAVAAMEIGKHSAAPVQTQFGFHVIKLMDQRSKEAQPFESVKDQINNMMIGTKVQEYVESLRSAAEIERN